MIAGLSGVSVHHYRFPEPGMYDPGVLSSVKQEYQTAGWTQLVNNHEKGGGPGVTDVWVRLENNAICNVAILVARPTDVNLILVSGSFSPLELSHLGGHFGIPKIRGMDKSTNGSTCRAIRTAKSMEEALLFCTKTF